MPEAAESTNRLRSVLAAMGIKRACFVDDVFSPEFPGAFAASERLASVGGAADLLAAWSCGTWTAESEEDDRTDAERKWDALDHEGRAALMQKLESLSPDPDPASEASFFSEYWPLQDCPLDLVGPERFNEEYIREFVLRQGPSIVFVDVSLGDGNEEGGLRLLEKVRRLDTDGKAICAFLTNRPEAEAGPQSAADYLDSLVKDSKVGPGAAVAISKTSIRDILHFEPELRRAFLNGLCPELRSWAKAVAESALNEALSGFKIEGDVLNYVVLQSSEREGVHPTETLFRLIDYPFREARDRLAVSGTDLAKFASLKSKLEALAKLTPAGEANAPLTFRVKQLRHTELYRARPATQWPRPISLGDLWEVTLVEDSREWAQTFVLIAQPCDIVLRPTNGKRSQEWALLVPIKKEGHTETTVELQCFDRAEFESRRADLKKARVTNVNVLDLVAVIGEKANRATISQLQTLRHVHRSVAERARHLAVWLEQALDSLPDRSSLALFSSPGPVAKLSIVDGTVDFCCQCVGRIEPELARLILQRYGNFVARYALAHEFAEFEK